ncbi:MAG TPA: hypothetical protein VMS77_04790 [Conexivisphaerales archaeon]|nr:hypothetical protein [Conexivisphaerales archaeon]
MKVAVATDDGRSVSQDLASAKFFVIRSVRPPTPPGRELRLKPRWVESRWSTEPEGAIGQLAREIVSSTEDCHLVVAGGAGTELHQGVVRAGRRVVLTDLVFVSDVFSSVTRGTLDDHPERRR